MPHAQVFPLFFVALGVTVVFLAAGMAFGYLRWIRAHMALIGLFLCSFLVTVAAAEMRRQHYHFALPARTVRLTLAIGTSLGTLFPLVTGLLRWREQGSLRQHRVAVYTWLVGVVATLGTGIWMLTVAERTAQSLAGR